VHRQLFGPLSALALASATWLVVARWNPTAAVLTAAVVYVGVFIKTDGPTLVLFLRSFARGRAV
ncbi:MAG: hypothetical protein ABR987_24120, partial [Terracidiphilus sp.]